jgi:hypothetical protein
VKHCPLFPYNAAVDFALGGKRVEHQYCYRVD